VPTPTYMEALLTCCCRRQRNPSPSSTQTQWYETTLHSNPEVCGFHDRCILVPSKLPNLLQQDLNVFASTTQDCRVGLISTQANRDQGDCHSVAIRQRYSACVARSNSASVTESSAKPTFSQHLICSTTPRDHLPLYLLCQYP
jgi:hypothetical protein